MPKSRTAFQHSNFQVSNLRRFWLCVVLSFLVAGCGSTFHTFSSDGIGAPEPAGNSPETTEGLSVNFKLNLTESNFNEARSVVLSVNHVELRLKKGAQEVRVITARNLGQVDLLNLRDSGPLSLAQFHVPDGVAVRQVRLVLDGQGHYLIRKNGSICDLPTPGRQQAGIRMSFPDTVTVEKGYGYELAMDLDARRSVTFRGLDGCDFGPVARLHSAGRHELDSPGRPEVPRQPPQSVLPPGSPIEQVGWDESQEVKLIPVVDPKDLPLYFD
jgi:hypothetical protein